jgi:hypothetical protein
MDEPIRLQLILARLKSTGRSGSTRAIAHPWVGRTFKVQRGGGGYGRNFPGCVRSVEAGMLVVKIDPLVSLAGRVSV